MSNKSYIGVDSVYYALVTQDDASAYVADTPAYLAPIMTVTHTPKVNSKVQYADNQPYDSMSSEGETEMEIELTGLSLQLQAILTGKIYDAASGRMFDHGGTPPDVAFGFRAKRRDGLYRYFWYLKCTPQAPTEEQATETDTPDPKSTKLKFTAIRTIYQWDLDGSVTDSAKRVVGDTEDANFSATTWFDDVQVPLVGSAPSLTCTPSPADAATGVAVSVSPTLTFSNALQTGVSGISIVSAAGAVVAAAITIDATNKIVTINPDANLTAATKYIITIAGARDVYGQDFAITAYDFTTA